MATVSLRFYAQLNDFLPAARRGQRFTHVLRGPSSVKDTIESIGVPHPEVDLILLNGTPQAFTHRLRDGDDVSVFPRFTSIELTGLSRVGADSPRPIRFALDVHLGKLASLLRLAGFDAVIIAVDADLAATAARDSRIVLTRDVGLLKRSMVQCGYWIRHTDPQAQLAEVLGRFDLAEQMEPFTRCTRCNTLVEPIDVESVADRLLPRTRERYREYRRCPGCGRVYWQGAHYDRLRALLARAVNTGALTASAG